MSAVFRGTALQLVRSNPVTDPVYGNATEIEYHGREAEILAALETFRSTCRCRVDSSQAPLFKLFVTFPNEYGSSDETPIDTWEVSTEPVQRSVWSHPLIDTEMNAAADPADYKTKVESAVNDNTVDLSAYTYAPMLVKELRRGVEQYETETIVLRRTRIVSPEYSTKPVLGETKFIYQASDIGVPADVQFSLPTLPSDPPQAKWGYRLRTQQVRFTYSKMGLKVEQVTEWVLAAWSTLLYEVYGT